MPSGFRAAFFLSSSEYRYAIVNDRLVIVAPRTRKIIEIIDWSRADVHSTVAPLSTTASPAGRAAEHSWGLAFLRWR
jgi:hypothetical protein